MSNPTGIGAIVHIDHDARREDITYMADTGETYERAARRLGITVHAFEKWLDRHAPELRARLRANERQSA